MTEFNFLPEPTDELPYSGNLPIGYSESDLDGGRYRSRFDKQVEKADEREGEED